MRALISVFALRTVHIRRTHGQFSAPGIAAKYSASSIPLDLCCVRIFITSYYIYGAEKAGMMKADHSEFVGYTGHGMSCLKRPGLSEESDALLKGFEEANMFVDIPLPY